jgi:hypothetical protein
VLVLITVYYNSETGTPSKQASGLTYISQRCSFKVFGYFKQEAGSDHPVYIVAKNAKLILVVLN